MNNAKDRERQDHVQARFKVKRSYGYSPISPKRTNDKVKLLSVNDGAENSLSLRSGTGWCRQSDDVTVPARPQTFS